MENTTTSPPPGQLMRLATWMSLATALLLVTVKSIAWGVTDSLSLLSSLVDSFLDLLVSLINFIAVRYALQPPDNEHRFGHGKAEDLAGMAQALFIGASALLIFIEAIKRFITPVPIENSAIGIGVMIISIVATSGLVTLQRHVVKKTGSNAIKADSLHYFTDLLSNSAVIIALLLSWKLGWTFIDPLFALFIAAYLFHGAWSIAQSSFHNLMDHEFDNEQHEQIMTIIRAHPGVLGVHNLKTRRSGINGFIQFHLDLNGDLTLRDAHRIADAIEKELMSAFPRTEVIIHEDPVPK